MSRNQLESSAALIMEAYKRHSDNVDWYAAQLTAAVAHTTSLEEAIRLADAMYEDAPTPPSTSDEEEQVALEQLAEQVSGESSALSLDAAFASVDRRGVEHHGKGSSKGGQFAPKGAGEGDIMDVGSADVVDLGRAVGSASERDVMDAVPVGDDAQAEAEAEALARELEMEGKGDPERIDEFGLELSETEIQEAGDQENERIDNESNVNPVHREQVRQKLRTMPITKQRNLGGGMNGTYLVTLEDGSQGVWKPSNEEKSEPWIWDERHVPQGEQYKREVAAHDVAEILGMGDLVPETVFREHNGTTGSVQRFHTTANIAFDFQTPTDHVSKDDKIRSAIFDYITMNSDRRDPNWMMDRQNRPVLIDNGLGFPEKIEFHDAPSFTFVDNDVRSEPIPESIRNWASKHKEVARAIDEAGIGEAGRNGAVRRLQRLGDRNIRTLRDYLYHQGLYEDYHDAVNPRSQEDKVIDLSPAADDEEVHIEGLNTPEPVIDESPIKRPKRPTPPPVKFVDVKKRVDKFIADYGSEVHDDELLAVIKKAYGENKNPPDPNHILKTIKDMNAKKNPAASMSRKRREAEAQAKQQREDADIFGRMARDMDEEEEEEKAFQEWLKKEGFK